MSDLATGALTPELERGLAAVKVSEQVRAAARQALSEWLTDPAYVAYRPLLERLIADQAYPLLVDAFYQVLPFGTGGRRGPVGPGPNRFNPMTLASSVAGHLEFLRDRFGQSGIKVVIGYDSRAFQDVRGLYFQENLGPLAGLTSRTFAELAARVYTSAGVDVYLSARIMATPELSFAIRELRRTAGSTSRPRTTRPTTTAASSTTSAAASRCRPTTRRWWIEWRASRGSRPRAIRCG